jgi:hypothetical protein
MQWRSINATRLVATTYGVLAGFAGVEHGFFEILQGNTVPSGIMIQAIGPAQRFWPHGGEPAMTLIPNFFVTGALAMLVGVLVMVWAAAFVQRKHGGLILILLSIFQLLVGGGIMPIFLAATAGVVATRINAPLSWRRVHIPIGVRNFFADLFPWSFVVFLCIYFFALEIAIIGFVPGVPNPFGLLWTIAYVMMGVFIFVAIAGLVYDMQKTGIEMCLRSLKHGSPSKE